MVELFFTVYIASTTGASQMVYGGSYQDMSECLDKANSEKRIELQEKYPKAAIAAYCVPTTFVEKHMRDSLKVLGWH